MLPEMSRVTLSKFSSARRASSRAWMRWLITSTLVPERKAALMVMLPSKLLGMSTNSIWLISRMAATKQAAPTDTTRPGWRSSRGRVRR